VTQPEKGSDLQDARQAFANGYHHDLLFMHACFSAAIDAAYLAASS